MRRSNILKSRCSFMREAIRCRICPGSDSYLSGQPGDWLVARQENLKDVYIVKKDIFVKSYERQL